MGTVARARIIIEIKAGVLLNEPMPEHTRQFTISSEQWENPEEVMKVYGHAQEYHRNLWHPGKVNWVNCNWIYL